MLHDSGADNPNRFFIFGTDDNIRLLQENRHWFADGTFKMSPHLFYQVHTIHVLCQGCVVPVVCLDENKTKQSYIPSKSVCLAENSKSWFDRSLHRKGRCPSVVQKCLLRWHSCLHMTFYAHSKNCKTSFLKKLMHCWITLKIRG